MKRAFKHSIPILAGFIVLGMAYGILMDSKGYNFIWSTLMSIFAFGGSMQFVAITLLTTTFDPLEAFLLSLMVNARHIFYSISMLQKYKGTGKAKFFLIFLLCDETFSVNYSLEVKEEEKTKMYLLISILNYSYWVIGTLLGGLFGSFVKFNTLGLDFVLTALFVVIFLEQMLVKKNRVFGIIGIVSSLLSLIIFGSSKLVIASMLSILSVLLIFRRKLCH